MAVAATWHTLTRMLLQLVYIVRESCPAGRLLQPWDLLKEKELESEKETVKAKEEKDKGKNVLKAGSLTDLNTSGIEDNSSANGLNNCVDTRPLRYVEKEREGTNPSQPLPQSLPLKAPSSSVIMLLSDGCIEDISSLLFTTVVANLSAIVGHDIDGQPINIPKRLTTLQSIAAFFDPYGLMGVKGIC